jgi:hypothetical protein
MMSNDPLIPIRVLEQHHPELLGRIEQLDPPPSADLTSGPPGEAYARALLFERWPELVLEEPVDPARSFYNRYFWFARFAALWQAAHGHNAGLEQQVFQLLEQADFDIDWDVVQELDARAKQDLGPSRR